MAQIRIDDKLHERIKTFIKDRIGGIGEWVEKFIEEGLKKHGGRKVS